MADILATLFRFRQFLFEYIPFLLVAWLGVAVATGVITIAMMRKADSISAGRPFPRRRTWGWPRGMLLALLWQPGRESPALNFNGWRLFGLVASVPGLVATALIGLETMWLRLTLATLFSLSLGRFFISMVLRSDGNPERQPPEPGAASPDMILATDSTSFKERRANIIQVVWRSFSSQVEGALIPLLIGFGLASALTIYVPAYVIQPWVGEGTWTGAYLGAVLVAPFQLMGGAEAVLASALLVKGASLGTTMSVMLAGPAASFSMLRQIRKVRAKALYLVAVWITAGTLGVALDGIGRLFDAW